MEYNSPETNNHEQNLRVLNAASQSPDREYESNPAVRDAFDRELRQLAEEIVAHHPSLTQLLLSLSGECITARVVNPIHGQN